MGQSDMQEDWFAVLKCQETEGAQIIKYDCFYNIFWTADLFTNKFIFIVCRH